MPRVPTCTESSPSIPTCVPQLPPAIPVRLCAAEACQAVGGRQLRDEWAHLCEHEPELAEMTGVDEPIYCLGNCALGPAALVGERLVAAESPPSGLQTLSASNHSRSTYDDLVRPARCCGPIGRRRRCCCCPSSAR